MMTASQRGRTVCSMRFSRTRAESVVLRFRSRPTELRESAQMSSLSFPVLLLKLQGMGSRTADLSPEKIDAMDTDIPHPIKPKILRIIFYVAVGVLPTPVKDGYACAWYTAKSGGKEVTSQTKVNDDKAHTLYAHWKKAEKKKYKVSFVKNVPEEDEDKVTLNKDEIKVEEGGKYESMPSAEWDKHKFEGWYTEADEGAGTKVKASDKFSGTSDQTLYAHWSDDTLGWWNKRFEETANNIEPESKVIIALDEGDDHDKKLVDECKGKLAEEGETPEYIVKIIKNYSEESAKTTAEEVYNTVSAEKPDVKVIILSDEVHKGSDEQKLLYKMMLMDAIYGSFGSDLDSAAADLDATVFYPYVYSKDAGAEEPGIEEIGTEEQGTQGTEEPGVEVIDTENQGVEEISTVN